MADIILFTVPVPVGAEATPDGVKLYQSATLTGVRSVVATETLVNLGYLSDPPEDLTWVVSAADPSQYSWIVLTTGVAESQPALLAPAAAAGLVTLETWTENVIGVAQAGMRFQADPIKGHASAGDKTIAKMAYDTTDVNGYASLTLYADSGMYKITLAGKVVAPQFDTTGQSGQSINLADILA